MRTAHLLPQKVGPHPDQVATVSAPEVDRLHDVSSPLFRSPFSPYALDATHHPPVPTIPPRRSPRRSDDTAGPSKVAPRFAAATPRHCSPRPTPGEGPSPSPPPPRSASAAAG